MLKKNCDKLGNIFSDISGPKPTPDRHYCLPAQIKNVLCQITLSEDEAFPPRYHFCYRIFPGLSVLSPAYASGSSGFVLRFNRFPYNGGIPVRVNQFWHSCLLQICPDSFRPDCSQVIASLTMLFPHTIRKLSESTPVMEVLSCSSHWLFSIRFYYSSKIRFVNRKLDCTLFLFWFSNYFTMFFTLFRLFFIIFRTTASIKSPASAPALSSITSEICPLLPGTKS